MKLKANDKLSKDSMVQLWCEKCERFLADRYVEGTCPNVACNFPDARGDQCDLCGKLLNAEELVNPKCKICSTRPVPKDSEHMFLKLDEIQEQCQKWVERSNAEGLWLFFLLLFLSSLPLGSSRLFFFNIMNRQVVNKRILYYRDLV